jgi:hypothetical protein
MGELVNTYFNNYNPTPVGVTDAALESHKAYGTTTARGGYHPNNMRMLISSEKGGLTVRCHYDPTDFTETYSMDWAVTPVTGKSTSPVEFKTVNPREWSMKLLFNSLGEDAKRQTNGLDTVEASLATLRKMSMPSFYSGGSGRTSSDESGERPPTLLVFLTDQAFRCVITRLTVTRKAIHPQSRAATRAEVDIAFTEFVESAT